MGLKKYCFKADGESYEVEANSKREAKKIFKSLYSVNPNVNNLLKTPKTEKLSFGQRTADIVTRALGSWKFLLIQSTILFLWVLLNVCILHLPWDPYPFILLNLTLSFQAAYAAPIIMMSQNRQEAKDRQTMLLNSDVGKANLVIDKQTNENIAEILYLLADTNSRLDQLEKRMKNLQKRRRK